MPPRRSKEITSSGVGVNQPRNLRGSCKTRLSNLGKRSRRQHRNTFTSSAACSRVPFSSLRLALNGTLSENSLEAPSSAPKVRTVRRAIRVASEWHCLTASHRSMSSFPASKTNCTSEIASITFIVARSRWELEERGVRLTCVQRWLVGVMGSPRKKELVGVSFLEVSTLEIRNFQHSVKCIRSLGMMMLP